MTWPWLPQHWDVFCLTATTFEFSYTDPDLPDLTGCTGELCSDALGNFPVNCVVSWNGATQINTITCSQSQLTTNGWTPGIYDYEIVIKNPDGVTVWEATYGCIVVRGGVYDGGFTLGPTGPTGATGPTGPTGPSGANGVDAPYQMGTVTAATQLVIPGGYNDVEVEIDATAGGFPIAFPVNPAHGNHVTVTDRTGHVGDGSGFACPCTDPAGHLIMDPANGGFVATYSFQNAFASLTWKYDDANEWVRI